jgi:hypothetical protein
MTPLNRDAEPLHMLRDSCLERAVARLEDEKTHREHKGAKVNRKGTKTAFSGVLAAVGSGTAVHLFFRDDMSMLDARSRSARGHRQAQIGGCFQPPERLSR